MTSSSLRLPANDKERIAPEPSYIPSYRVEDRQSLELVIAFVGPVASGVSSACRSMQKQLEEDFGYTVEYIKVSSLIGEFAHQVDEVIPPGLVGAERIKAFQHVGSKLRERFDPGYLADRALEKISLTRRGSDAFVEVANGPDVVLQKRAAYIIDSLKNPEELNKLKLVYGKLCWVVTVFAPHEVRERRLRIAGSDELAVLDVMKRDAEEGILTGQKVSATAHLADYFIRNHTDVADNLTAPVKRFLEVVFNTKLHTPTIDETGMIKAAAAAIRSACLSRQVGAAIYSSKNELLGTGCNDVPKFGGGLYSEAVETQIDNRCYRWGGGICHNDSRKQKMAENIAKAIVTELDDKKRGDFTKTYDIVSKSEARNLIEFSRSVHAEMEAIVSIARSGAGSTVGGTLYSTTFPCHNCARHIVAAGITKVVFIEPYSKSLALDLHYDSITLVDEAAKVHFVQYEGFSPTAALSVFSSVDRSRKIDGKLVSISARLAKPIYQCPLDSYINTEGLVVQHLAELQPSQG